MAVTATTAKGHWSSETASTAAMTVATTATTAGLGSRSAASAVIMRIATATAMAATGPRICRGCNRQRGYAGGENQPGHCKNSFRTEKTVSSMHRSIGSTDGTCVLAH
jgi:hypothetical protein